MQYSIYLIIVICGKWRITYFILKRIHSRVHIHMPIMSKKPNQTKLNGNWTWMCLQQLSHLDKWGCRGTFSFDWDHVNSVLAVIKQVISSFGFRPISVANIFKLFLPPLLGHFFNHEEMKKKKLAQQQWIKPYTTFSYLSTIISLNKQIIDLFLVLMFLFKDFLISQDTSWHFERVNNDWKLV